MKKFIRHTLHTIEAVMLFIAGMWCVGVAVWFWQFSAAEVILWSAVLLVIWIAGFAKVHARVALFVIELCVAGSFALQTPEKQFDGKAWRAECKNIAEISWLKDDMVKIGNVRDFKYRTPGDFDRGYRDVIVDLKKLESMDIAFSHWDEMEMVAHMLLCFNFKDGQKLAVSLEPRVPEGMHGGDFFLGLYRRYGQMMIIGTPEDLLDLRSKYRGETLYLYRTIAGGEVLRRIFCRVLKDAEKLQSQPEFYNSLTENCTTGLLNAINQEDSLRGWDMRKLFNGFYDKYLFEKDFLERRSGESFGSLKSRSYVPGLSSGN